MGEGENEPFKPEKHLNTYQNTLFLPPPPLGLLVLLTRNGRNPTIAAKNTAALHLNDKLNVKKNESDVKHYWATEPMWLCRIVGMHHQEVKKALKLGMQ